MTSIWDSLVLVSPDSGFYQSQTVFSHAASECTPALSLAATHLFAAVVRTAAASPSDAFRAWLVPAAPETARAPLSAAASSQGRGFPPPASCAVRSGTNRVSGPNLQPAIGTPAGAVSISHELRLPPLETICAVADDEPAVLPAMLPAVLPAVRLPAVPDVPVFVKQEEPVPLHPPPPRVTAPLPDDMRVPAGPGGGKRKAETAGLAAMKQQPSKQHNVGCAKPGNSNSSSSNSNSKPSKASQEQLDDRVLERVTFRTSRYTPSSYAHVHTPGGKRWFWPEELHTHFVRAFTALNGTGTPRQIMDCMRQQGAPLHDLSVSQVRSHLQKYRIKLASVAAAMSESEGSSECDSPPGSDQSESEAGIHLPDSPVALHAARSGFWRSDVSDTDEWHQPASRRLAQPMAWSVFSSLPHGRAQPHHRESFDCGRRDVGAYAPLLEPASLMPAGIFGDELTTAAAWASSWLDFQDSHHRTMPFPLL